jgi:hypothetical protein
VPEASERVTQDNGLSDVSESAVRRRAKFSKSFEFRQVACTATSLHSGITSFISFYRITCIVLRSCRRFRIVTPSMLPHTGGKLQSIIEARHKSLYSGGLHTNSHDVASTILSLTSYQRCVMCFKTDMLFPPFFICERPASLKHITHTLSNIARPTLKRTQKNINVSFKPTVSISSNGLLILAFNKPLLEGRLSVQPTFMPDSMDPWRLFSKGKLRRYNDHFEAWLI